MQGCFVLPVSVHRLGLGFPASAPVSAQSLPCRRCVVEVYHSQPLHRGKDDEVGIQHGIEVFVIWDLRPLLSVELIEILLEDHLGVWSHAVKEDDGISVVVDSLDYASQPLLQQH
eukprot:gene15264-biopygen4953